MKMEFVKGKIPIKIDGYNNFVVVAGIDGFLVSTLCGKQYDDNLEEGIESTTQLLRYNAKTYLMRMADGLENNKFEDFAFKIATHKGNVEELFFLEYPPQWNKKIEQQLGKYNKLERVMIKK